MAVHTDACAFTLVGVPGIALLVLSSPIVCQTNLTFLTNALTLTGQNSRGINPHGSRFRTVVFLALVSLISAKRALRLFASSGARS